LASFHHKGHEGTPGKAPQPKAFVELCVLCGLWFYPAFAKLNTAHGAPRFGFAAINAKLNSHRWPDKPRSGFQVFPESKSDL
jgi:hypothetical protein